MNCGRFEYFMMGFIAGILSLGITLNLTMKSQYRQGQIDYANGKIHYKKVTTEKWVEVSRYEK